MKPSSSNSSNTLIMATLAVLLVLELTSAFAAAYPASYSAYYSPMGLEEPNPNYVNLQQAIERIRQAFIQNNELENKNDIDRLTVADLLDLGKAAFDIWFSKYQEELRLNSLLEIDDVGKRSQMASLRDSQIDRFSLDRILKRRVDFGSQRGHTGQKEYALREQQRIYPRERRGSLIDCSEILSKAGLDFGTRQSDAGSIENCLMTLRTELNRLGK
ncbi:uncharacterized protein [Euwallacea fornicatus]|uniref:uncharacterized protein n=1 Tax=Euwallacea fornicatus TaxID=995702 RepID=UPI0033903354